ncbi:CBO0543 family protein [Metabacillus arenae]|uniref:Uncharacterized protein n=1 Tax=Metabacillus arenae TaxID=2771434 RepID=A0A926NE46_9BACI|nr:CBO0543 family protein [Metabacillus arenae]MBD1378763.1 hypothetical protein [Metabacillus arenae]
MEKIILWLLVIIGIILFVISFKKPPFKNWIIVFLLTSYFAEFLGVLVVEEKMLEYPKRFLSSYFSSSILYEYLLFPVVCVYFCQTTYTSKFLSIVFQCILYTSALTITEVFFEKNTDLIKYHSWTWMHTFISTFILMMFIRFLIQMINKKK